MEGAIELKQYDGAQVLPKDDAILYDMIVGQNGIIYGCDITWLGSNQIHISYGYGIIKGRMFEVAEQTIYANLPSTTTSKYGYVVIALDLEVTDKPISIETILCASRAYEENGDWNQDENINIVNGVWEMPIAEYKATNAGISSFTDLIVKVKSIYKSINSFSEWEALGVKGYLLDAFLAREQIKTFENKKVPIILWTQNSIYEEYPYSAAVYCSGIDSHYVPNVIFGLEESVSGIFAPVAKSETNVTRIYAKEKPDYEITIPTIQCIRKVG